MSKAMIIIGGILGLFGGVAMLYQLLKYMSPGEMGWILNLIIIGIVILGGILGVARKKAGGGILLLMGIVLIVFGALSYLTPLVELLPYSGFTELGLGFPLSNLVAGIPLEAFIVLLGGILVLASPSN